MSHLLTSLEFVFNIKLFYSPTNALNIISEYLPLIDLPFSTHYQDFFVFFCLLLLCSSLACNKCSTVYIYIYILLIDNFTVI